ncbi:MAG TPA: exosortase K [Pyrinomonadaceae bacterium]|nr:exosortase K [Pyrinomonadaceae bacterium]
MSRRRIWSVQLLVVVLCALALKFYYSTATVNQLCWILTPTTALVELLSGRRFAFESFAGYMSSDHTFVIAASCAGINFLITSFLMLAIGRLWRERFQAVSWWSIPLAAVIAFVTTIITNTVRICIALELRNVHLDSLTANQLHRLEGIVVYFGFLLLLFLLTERPRERKPVRLLLFPLLIYYTTTLVIPLANGSWRHAGFLEHFIFVVVLPLIICAGFMCFLVANKYSRRLELTSASHC